MIRELLLELITWMIDMHRVDGGCAECMKCIHAVSAPVVARCIDCAFFDMFDGACMFGKPQPQGCDTLAAGCDMFQREDLTDCY